MKNSDEHYLLFDVDENVKGCDTALTWFKEKYGKIIWYPTHNGIHVIVLKPQAWVDTLKEMMDCPYVDLTWVALGIRRGYFFLQTYRNVSFPNATYMVVDRIG